MNRSESIKAFLTQNTHNDLASMYHKGMEVQVNVAQDGGTQIDGDFKGRHWRGFTNGIETWKPFRIPHNAKTNPEENDYEVKFDFVAHVEGIGMTGWDWQKKQSIWVAFDFDGLQGHSDKHRKKLTESQLEEVRQAVQDIPWVTVRKSTSGKGLHLYIFLVPVPTDNHNEHAAVARSILGMMSAVTRFDFSSKVDTMGGNMWVWHRKMKDTDGLSLLKQGDILQDIPVNWKDHLKVVRGERSKIVPSFITENKTPDIEKLFEEISGQKSNVPLDDEHIKLITWLNENRACGWWDADNHMLVTHTIHLKEAHDKLNLKGIFKTIATGKDYGQDWNLFAFPMRNGAWVIRRYSPGVAEDPTWDQDGQGFTRCFFNRNPDLNTVAKAHGGVEHKTGGFVFREAEVAVEAAKQLGIHMEIPGPMGNRRTKIKEQKDGRILVEIDHDAHDVPEKMKGWLADGKQWHRIFKPTIITNSNETETGNYDNIVRHLTTETGTDYGWMLNSEGDWREEPLEHVKIFLSSLGLGAKETKSILGSCISKAWKIVCRPFEPEYPVGMGREWNRNAPQLQYPLNQNQDSLTYPTWLKILNHCGESLNEPLKYSEWAKSNYIFTGADYLKVWIASLFQKPREPLPYLFLYGPQDSGKSIFHEAISLLMTSGVVRADAALTSGSGFNGELEGGILCVIEETDMRKNKVAYNRIKDWVTAPSLPIHKKQRTPYSIPNTSHWVHCANDSAACPVLTGDSRITMLYVNSLKPEDKIAKRQFVEMLRKEASDFLTAVLTLELPFSNDRLNVPIIITEEKLQAERATRTDLEAFIDEKCFHVPGSLIKFSEFYDKFIEWIDDPNEIHHWNKIKVGKEIPAQFAKGRLGRENAQVYIGNISWDSKTKPSAKWIVRIDFLYQVEDKNVTPNSMRQPSL